MHIIGKWELILQSCSASPHQLNKTAGRMHGVFVLQAHATGYTCTEHTYTKYIYTNHTYSKHTYSKHAYTKYIYTEHMYTEH